MTAEQRSYTPPTEDQAPKGSALGGWETLRIGEEEFQVKKDRIFPVIHNGEEIPIKVNEYHHIESGTQITVFSLGMDKPINEPAIVRADYGCSCMSFGPEFAIPGHDCGKQRNMMFETLTEVGNGAVAIVSEKIAGGNGHGDHLIFDQSTVQFQARQNGEQVPTMQEFYSEQGYFPFDKRRHDLVGKALVDTVGTERISIPAMSSQKKIQDLKDAGLNILDGLRVELVTDTTGFYDHNLRRDNYMQKPTVKEPGAYLVFNKPDGSPNSIRLIKDTYDMFFKPQHIKIPSPAPITQPAMI